MHYGGVGEERARDDTVTLGRVQKSGESGKRPLLLNRKMGCLVTAGRAGKRTVSSKRGDDPHLDGGNGRPYKHTKRKT